MQRMAAEKEQLDQDYDYYDESYDDEDDGTRGPIRLVVLAIVVAAFFGVGWIAYKQGIQEGKSNVPILKAETESLKEAPAETLPAPGPSREIFEKEPDKAAASKPEQLLPPPETPMTAPAKGSAAASAPPAAAAKPAATPPAPAVVAPKETAMAPPPPAPAAAPAVAKAAPAASIAAGAFLVQVAAARSDGEANAIWSKLQAKETDLLSAYSVDIQKVELAGKGTFHRVRFGPFASRDDAGQVCNALKARKQDCIVVKK